MQGVAPFCAIHPASGIAYPISHQQQIVFPLRQCLQFRRKAIQTKQYEILPALFPVPFHQRRFFPQLFQHVETHRPFPVLAFAKDNIAPFVVRGYYIDFRILIIPPTAYFLHIKRPAAFRTKLPHLLSADIFIYEAYVIIDKNYRR